MATWQGKITQKGQTEPTIWEIKSGGLRIAVVSGHIYHPGKYICHCAALHINELELGDVGEISLNEAQILAVRAVGKKLAELQNDFDKL